MTTNSIQSLPMKAFPLAANIVKRLTCEQKKKLLTRVLRTRKRVIPISLNGTTMFVPRNTLRDYLRKVLDNE